MKIYIDVLFFLNFAFDFLLLLSVSFLLRRGVKLRRLVLGGIVGGVSIFLLFLPMNSFTLFFFKLGMSLIMLLVSFGYRDIRYTGKNLLFLYMTSIVLGGILYFLNVTFSYKQEGLVFYHNGLSINMIVLIIFSPLILYIYIRQGIALKNQYAHYYQVKLSIDHRTYELRGFLDTGNHLKDPYTGKPILLIHSRKLERHLKNPILVPYQTASGFAMLPCMKIDHLEIKGIGIRKHVLVGILKDKIAIDGVDCILQEKILEGNYV